MTASHSSAASTLSASDQGHGEPTLLFIPGWCGDRTVFDRIAAACALHTRVITIDLPDHGGSPVRENVTTTNTVDDIITTLHQLGVNRVVPIGLSHAGWIVIELRRRLGPQIVPAVVLLDWMVLGTPPGFASALDGLQGPDWADVRAGLVGMWTDGLDLPELHAYVASMERYGQRHWQRAGREIQASFRSAPVPLEALAALQPCPTLHLYAQPADDEVLAAQQRFAAGNEWFEVTRLDARSHFPMLERPDTMAAHIQAFLRQACDR